MNVAATSTRTVDVSRTDASFQLGEEASARRDVHRLG